MAWPTVSITDVTNRFHPLDADDTLVATTRIADAAAELQRQLIKAGVTDAPAGDAQWAVTYTSTVAEMVIRFLENRGQWTEKTVAIDDWRETLRREKDDVSPGIWVSDLELERLLPNARRRRGAFSIHLGQS